MPDPLEFKRTQDAEIESLRVIFQKKSQEYLTVVKVKADKIVRVSALTGMVSAGRLYYRKCEDATLDRDGLQGDEFESWLRDRVGTAESVLTGLPKYHDHVRKERDKLGLNPQMFEPTSAFYQNMQGLLAATRPEAALKLKEIFIAANLPVVGFNNPYKPEPAKSSRMSKQNSPWSSGLFYLVSAFVFFLVIGLTVYFLPWYAWPIVIIGVVLLI